MVLQVGIEIYYISYITFNFTQSTVLLYQNETAHIGLLNRKILYVLYIFIFATCTLHINNTDHLEENIQVRVQLRMFHVKLLKMAVKQL